MSKRKETIEIENKLHYMCHKRRIYGCEEVTIGFVHNGHGDEIVDYCTMDCNGTLRCYEIKVTLSDLRSKAKKSWYGHYNYLLVTQELYAKIYKTVDEYIPDYVGVAVPCPSSWSDGIEIKIKAKKQELSADQEVMLKESLVRSMGYKLQKYREICDAGNVAALKKQLRQKEKECAKYIKETDRNNNIVSKCENILLRYYDKDISIRDLIRSIEHSENSLVMLPETIQLTLSERGKRRNQRVKSISEMEQEDTSE